MKPAAFEYHAPTTIDEAVALLAEHAPNDGRILAGGQSLVPTMAFRLARPTHLIDINNVAKLDKLAIEDGALCIGATVRHAQFHTPACDGILGHLLTNVVSNICPLPDPPTRYVLWQYRPFGPCLGMVHGRRNAGCHDGSSERFR